METWNSMPNLADKSTRLTAGNPSKNGLRTVYIGFDSHQVKVRTGWEEKPPGGCREKFTLRVLLLKGRRKILTNQSAGSDTLERERERDGIWESSSSLAEW